VCSLNYVLFSFTEYIQYISMLEKSYRYKSLGEKIVLVGHSYKLVVYKGLNRVPQGVRAINIDNIKNSCLDILALL
jgi:hypothetical protein